MRRNMTVPRMAILSVLCWALLQKPALAQQVGASSLSQFWHDVSPPLRDMAPMGLGPTELEEVPPPRPTEPLSASAAPVADPVLQSVFGPALSTIDLFNFDGMAHTGFAPPDTNGAVGATQFMQFTNAKVAVWDKSTTDLVLGPISGSTLFSGMGAPCETNHGDGIIVYDKAADRWMFSQLVDTPTVVCIAVSASFDATDIYYRYAFDLSQVLPAGTTLSDYPKFGVWPDGYYYTANIFGQTGGTNICAFDRANMLLNNDATAQCFFSRTIGASYLPADLDGSTPPPDGSPNFLVDINNSGQELRLVAFQVDWSNPDNSTLSDAVHIPVASFSPASGGVPQLDSTGRLDTLGDRLMFRLAYRNFGDHESLVANHSVSAAGRIGLRWYELRDPNNVPYLYQQGTYMPDDAIFRWMGSIAMDQAGDIALGYSASSADIYPAIRYTARTPDDPLGTMEDERSIIEGGGSQTRASHQRWGDYSSMIIDPVDNCTFWYTTEYYQTSGSIFNWSTRIASFQFPSCSAPTTTAAITQKVEHR